MKKLRNRGYVTTAAALAAFVFGGEAAAQQVGVEGGAEVAASASYAGTDAKMKLKIKGLPVIDGLALALRDRDFIVEKLDGESLDAHANFMSVVWPVVGLDGYLSVLGQVKDLDDLRYGANVKGSLGPFSGYVTGTSSFDGWDPILNSGVNAEFELGNGFGLRASLEDFDDNGVRSGKKIDRQELEMEVTYKGFGLGVGAHDWSIRNNDALMDIVKTTEPVLTFKYSTGLR